MKGEAMNYDPNVFRNNRYTRRKPPNFRYYIKLGLLIGYMILVICAVVYFAFTSI
ncbi:hypothetical protein ABH899_004917 [Paenibacillus sp. RC84]